MILITSQGCSPCKTVKSYLSQRDIDIEVLDIDLDDQALDLASKYSIRGVPALIKDDTVIMGVDNILEAVNSGS